MTNTTIYNNNIKKRTLSARFLHLKYFSHCYYIGLCLISWFTLPVTLKQIQPKSISQIILESLKDNLAVCTCTYLIASISEMIGQIISVSFMSEPWKKSFSQMSKWQWEGCFQWEEEAKSWLVSMETLAASGRTAVEEEAEVRKAEILLILPLWCQYHHKPFTVRVDPASWLYIMY